MTKVSEITSRAIADTIEYYKPVESFLNSTAKQYYDAIALQSGGLTLPEVVSKCKADGAIFYVPNGKTLVVTETLDLTWVNVCIEGTVESRVKGICLIVGSSSTSPMTTTVDIFAVTHQNYQDGDISVQIQGVMNGDISIRYAQKVKLWADGNIPSISSISYSKFFFGTVYRLEISSNITAAAIGWITECVFFQGRYTEILIDGNFDHEELVFIKPCIEAGTLTLNRGKNCKFIHIRNENSATKNFKLYLSDKTSGNFIEIGTYDSSWSTLYLADFLKSTGDVVDLGRENFITNQIAENYKEFVVFDVIANVTFKNNWCAYKLPSFDPSFISLSAGKDFVSVKPFSSLFKKTFPVGNIKRFKIHYEGVNTYGDNVVRGYDVSMLCYDANKNLITTKSIDGLNLQFFAANGAHTLGAARPTFSHFLITNPNVAYLYINIFPSSPDANYVQIKRLALSLFTDPNNEFYAKMLHEDVLRRDFKVGTIPQSTATDVATLKNDFNNLLSKLTQSGIIGGVQDSTDINVTDYKSIETLYGLPTP